MPAGTIGDALGTSVEFMTLDQIRGTHGESGLTGQAQSRNMKGIVS